MSRRVFVQVAAVIAGFAAGGFATEQVTGRPHLGMALAAVGVGLMAVALAAGVERLATRRGVEVVVLGYFLGVGVRGTVAIVGACVLAAFVFDLSDRAASLLWVLAAYLTGLAFETVRAVRAADLEQLANPGSGGGPNE